MIGYLSVHSSMLLKLLSERKLLCFLFLLYVQEFRGSMAAWVTCPMEIGKDPLSGSADGLGPGGNRRA